MKQVTKKGRRGRKPISKTPNIKVIIRKQPRLLKKTRQNETVETQDTLNQKNHSDPQCQQVPKNDSPRKEQKEAPHYPFRLGEKIQGQYKVTEKLGDGTFGRVLGVLDIFENKEYAIKMIRAVPRYVQAAKVPFQSQIEFQILKEIQKQKNEDLIQIYHSFVHENNFCIVFEKLGLSLFEYMQQFTPQGYPIRYVQEFFKQILQQIKYCHDMQLTHTDIKPENMLLVDSNEYKNYTFKKQDQSFLKEAYGDQRMRVPSSKKIKLIDFGGATFSYEHHSRVINTRQYRAPEVIMCGAKWNEKSDLWSIACVIIELYSGNLLFDTHNTHEHLMMIEKVSNRRFPTQMIESRQKDVKDFFSRNRLITHDINPNFIHNTNSTKRIDEIVDKEHQNLRDLLKKLLVIDPEMRLSCEDALAHQFFHTNKL